MRTKLLTLLFATIGLGAFAQNVGIGNTSFTPHASSVLELRSTTAGFLMPRMTQAQRNAISNPANGLMIYQTDNTPGYYFYSMMVLRGNRSGQVSTTSVIIQPRRT